MNLRKVPVTVFGNKTIVGFNRDALAEALQLSFIKEEKIADRKHFDALDMILEAVVRASRQIPPEQVMWKTPDRDRPMKVFCYHILADPNHVIDAITTHKYDGSFKLTYAEASERFKNMEEVAQFGEETRKRLRHWSQFRTGQDLERPIEAYSGRTNGHELLHHVLAHTAHHLKQLYECLRMLGVTPSNPLKEEEFAWIKTPQKLW